MGGQKYSKFCLRSHWMVLSTTLEYLINVYTCFSLIIFFSSILALRGHKKTTLPSFCLILTTCLLIVDIYWYLSYFLPYVTLTFEVLSSISKCASNDWVLTKPRLCSKLLLFKTSWQMLYCCQNWALLSHQYHIDI